MCLLERKNGYSRPSSWWQSPLLLFGLLGMSWLVFLAGCHFHLITIEEIRIEPKFGGGEPDMMIEFGEVEDGN